MMPLWEYFYQFFQWLLTWFIPPQITFAEKCSKDAKEYEIKICEPLTPAEFDAVKSSWSIVEKDLKGHSLKLFLHFLEIYPQYQKKFSSFSKVEKEKLPTHPGVKAHAFTVGTALSGFVANLDDAEMLAELLYKTGVNHKDRGLNIQDFENLNTAILEYLGIALGDLWTDVVVNGWKKTLNVVLRKVQEGLANHEE